MPDSIPLHYYLDASRIHIHSELSSSKKLLQEMAILLASSLPENPELDLTKEVYHSLLEREKLGNTGIGNGIALPHSRFDGADTAVIAIITLKNAIDYDSIDREDVDLAFGLLVPQEATNEHLAILAKIAKAMSETSNKKRLLRCTTVEQALEVIHQWED